MRLKLRSSIVLAVVVGLLIPATVGSLLTLRQQQAAFDQRLAADHVRIAEVLAYGVENALWNVTPEAARPLVDSVLGDERIVKVVAFVASTPGAAGDGIRCSCWNGRRSPRSKIAPRST